MSEINEKFNDLVSQRDKLNEEIKTLQEECPHDYYHIGLFSWRVGAYALKRICSDCGTVLGEPSHNEIEDYNKEMESLKDGEPTGQGSKIYENRMKLDKITFTGADDEVDPQKLVELSEKYPFVEWGILFSKKREGQDRYPTQEWIDKVSDLDVNLSAHFCGWYSKQVMEEDNHSLIKNLPDAFKRVQINYRFKDMEYWQLQDIIFKSSGSNKKIILQHNENNKKVLDIMKNTLRDADILYDSSGGTGKEINDVQEPFDSAYTGYSGGLNPDNIVEVYNKIREIRDGSTFWMDLESGARTDDKFDLEKVEAILEKMSKFIYK